MTSFEETLAALSDFDTWNNLPTRREITLLLLGLLLSDDLPKELVAEEDEEKNAFSFYDEDYWLLNKYLIKTWTCLL